MNNTFLHTPIDYLKGVGPNRSKLFKKELKIFTYQDLLSFFPYRYVDKTKYHKINEINNMPPNHSISSISSRPSDNHT